MRLYKDKLIPTLIFLGFLFALFFTMLQYSSMFNSISTRNFVHWYLLSGGIIGIYLVGFRIPLDIAVTETEVIVKCICWRYKFKMTYKFRVSSWGGNYHSVVFDKISIFWIPSGSSVNKDFIRNLPLEMKQKVKKN